MRKRGRASFTPRLFWGYFLGYVRWLSYLPPKNTEVGPRRPCVRCAAIRIARLAFVGAVFVPRGMAYESWPRSLNTSDWRFGPSKVEIDLALRLQGMPHQLSQGPPNGGVSNGGVSRSGLVLPFLSFFAFFGTFPIFPGFSRFARGWSEDFPRFGLFLFLSLLRAPTRNSPERVRDTIWTFSEKSGKHPGLETPRFSFSQLSSFEF